VLHAVAVDAGAVPTASGLVVATAEGAVTG
jgi:hypothetical protein